MPAPLGPRSATTSPGATSSATSTPRAATRAPQLQAAHSPPPWRAGPRPSTITTATTTSTQPTRHRRLRVGLPLQVDLQRQRPRHTLQAPGECQGGAELAESAGEREHRTRDQSGQHQRDRDAAQHRRGAGAESGGDGLVAAARGAQRTLEAYHQERQRHERLGQHHRAVVENAIWMPATSRCRPIRPCLPKV